MFDTLCFVVTWMVSLDKKKNEITLKLFSILQNSPSSEVCGIFPWIYSKNIKHLPHVPVRTNSLPMFSCEGPPGGLHAMIWTIPTHFCTEWSRDLRAPSFICTLEGSRGPFVHTFAGRVRRPKCCKQHHWEKHAVGGNVWELTGAPIAWFLDPFPHSSARGPVRQCPPSRAWRLRTTRWMSTTRFRRGTPWLEKWPWCCQRRPQWKACLSKWRETPTCIGRRRAAIGPTHTLHTRDISKWSSFW